MALFLITIFVWAITLFFLRPNPSNLQTKIPSFQESFRGIQATFCLGIFMIVVFFILSGGTFNELNDDWFAIFGVNNLDIFTPWWFIQTVTHNFIHFNWMHLWTNLSFLGMLSLYERNVRARRFLLVFLFSGVFSSVSMLFILSPSVAAGASAGLYGLAAAYLLDTPMLTLKEYLLGFGLIILLFLILSYGENKRMVDSLPFNIDTGGHILGLIFGAIYCKLFPRKAAAT